MQPLQGSDIAAFLGLTNYNPDQMDALLRASISEANMVVGRNVPPDQQSQAYQQGVRHLAARFYAAGNSDVKGLASLPLPCRYLFELVRRELSGPQE